MADDAVRDAVARMQRVGDELRDAIRQLTVKQIEVAGLQERYVAAVRDVQLAGLGVSGAAVR